jgi:nitrite reductase/ring-hydroxylating ferredoxin subunit/uncharacterized membrane protein
MSQEPAPSFGANPIFESIVRSTQDQVVVERVAQQVQPALKKAFDANSTVKNLLHGTWIGHPLHPVLTDIPIGAWTMAAVFDALNLRNPQHAYARAAKICVGAGIIGALGAAVTGLADWSETKGRPARIGVVHATCNSIALALYTMSFLTRRRARRTGIAYAYAGYAMATVGAGLGGHLVFGEMQGVNHATASDLPTEWTRLLPVQELIENSPHRADLNGRSVVLVKQGATVYALLETCAHAGGPLGKGTVEDCSIRCPWHGSRFALQNGRVLEGPATSNQPTFETRVVDGQVEVRAFSREAP